jgi:hypothetical protein
MALKINPPLYYNNVPLVAVDLRYYLCSVFFTVLIFAKLTVDYCIDKRPLDLIANQLNPIYTFTPYLRSTLIVSSRLNQSLLVLISPCEVLRQICFGAIFMV